VDGQRVKIFVCNNRKLSVKEMAEAQNMSKEASQWILAEKHKQEECIY
jgi:orotate phosphoribosyltransferase-like protein